MILVVLAIAFSLALTYGFMRTQVTSLQVTQNEIRRDLALDAARTGISAGLLRMQDPAWAGISDTYSKTTQQDSSNLVTCAVTFAALASGQVTGVSDSELPLHVCITSVGTWTSPHDSALKVNRTVKAVVRLMPRLPGRTARAGDVASATDVSTNLANYQATLPYTLTTTGATSTSLNFNPGARFEGPIWLNHQLAFFNSATWTNTIRGNMLTEIGKEFGSSSPGTFVHPHPMNGPVRFSTTPSNSIQTDLGRLKTSWSTTTDTPSLATLNVNSWQSYRLYDRGPVYQATTLSSSLSNVTLRPSATNPLGIYVRSGNLDIYDSVIVQGTLVVTGTVTFWGKKSSVTAYNWIGSTGSAVATDADKWPRLPAIVAANVAFSDSARQVIEGAVLIDGRLSGGGGNFGYTTVTSVNLSGTATATRGQQPYSTVQLQGSPDLSSLTGGQDYAIWLANGTSGRWYAIDSVNTTAKTVTILGEASCPAAVSYTIRQNRSSSASLNGPVVTGSISVDSESMWAIATNVWTNTHNDWNNTNSYRTTHGQAAILFPDWVADPTNLINQGWVIPFQTMIYGLELEPTFSIQPTTGVSYLSGAPLFTPYASSGSDASASGYRWKVVDWREDI